MNLPNTLPTDISLSSTRNKHSVALSVNGNVVLHAQEAVSFLGRLRGLHAFLPLADNEALIIRSCNAIHTFTMRQSIDVIFLSRSGQILNIRTVKPLRWCGVLKAAVVIELNAGMCERLNIKTGDRINRDKGMWV